VERASPLAGYFTSCGNIHDGVLAYRLAGLPLTLNLLVERGLDHFRKPEDRVVQEATGTLSAANLSMWELRHQLTHVLLLLRLPFLFAVACSARACGGSRGDCTATWGLHRAGLYCFSPAVIKACVAPSPEVLAALGVYAVSIPASASPTHAGTEKEVASADCAADRSLWNCRRLTHCRAAPGGAAGLLGDAMVSEGRRSRMLPVVPIAAAGAMILVFACYGSRRMLSVTCSAPRRDDVGFFRSGNAVLFLHRQRRNYRSRGCRGGVLHRD